MRFVFSVYRIERKQEYAETMYRVRIFNTGEVKLFVDPIYTFPCTLDIRKYPFDVHTCNTNFASWRYSMESLDVWNNTTQLEHLISESYVPNQQWDLVDVREISEVIGYSNFTKSGDTGYFKHTKYSITEKKSRIYCVNAHCSCCAAMSSHPDSLLAPAGFYRKDNHR